MLKLWRTALSPGRAIGGSFSRAFSLREVREKYDRRNCAVPRCDPGVVAFTGIYSKRGGATNSVEKPRIVIGRADADIEINDNAISRWHCASRLRMTSFACAIWNPQTQRTLATTCACHRAESLFPVSNRSFNCHDDRHSEARAHSVTTARSSSSGGGIIDQFLRLGSSSD